MSRTARTWAVGQDIKGASKAVLVVLADHANEAHRAWPSIPLIAQTTGRSERAVQYALTELQARGAIEIERSIGGRGRASHYILNLEWVYGTTAPPGAAAAHRNGAKIAPIRPVNGANSAPFEAVNGANTAPIQPETVQSLHPSDPPPAPLNGAILTLNGAKVAPEPKIEPKKEESKEVRARATASRRPPARTPLPEGWQPNAEGKGFAINLGLGVPMVAAKFSAWHRKHATRSADWVAEWELWCLREVEMNARQPERRANHFAEAFWDDLNRAAQHPEDADAEGRRAIEQICGVTYGTA